MECSVCHTRPNAKSSLTCSSCVKKNIKKWSEMIDGKEQEKLELITKNQGRWNHHHLPSLSESGNDENQKIADSIKKIQQDLVLKKRMVSTLQKQVERIQEEITFQKKRYKDLLSMREELKSRKTSVELLHGQSLVKDQLNSPKFKKEEENRMELIKYKKILIRDLVNIFKLRKVRVKSHAPAAAITSKGLESEVKVEEEVNETINYRIVTVGPPPATLFNSAAISHLQVKKLNALLFYSSHLLLLLSYYLSSPLPFPIYFKSGYPWIRFEVIPIPRINPQDQSSSSLIFKSSEFITTGLKPLFMGLDSSNNENLLLGFATLNYDISWLAKTQGVTIPLSETSDTLQMLALMCASPSLGTNDPANLSNNTRPAFESLEYDLDDVVQVHLDLATKPWEVIESLDAESDIPESNDDWNVVDDL